jgi:hypothetical protein
MCLGIFYGLFNYAFSSSDSTVSNEEDGSEYWIGKDVEGSGHGLIEGTSLVFAWGGSGK